MRRGCYSYKQRKTGKIGRILKKGTQNNFYMFRVSQLDVLVKIT
ncbi:hypothetical protein OIU78_009030 [Salix suchowensis]|nr:hypothetical protein OIU78_009030 [Salix suchowensis]